MEEEQRITAEYVALAGRVGPLYNRFCHLGFMPVYVIANPCFAGPGPIDIAAPAVLPSDRWTIPSYPSRPFVVDGDLLFDSGIIPLTVLTEVAPPSGGSLLCVPIFFSIGSLLADRAWAAHPGGVIPRGIVRLNMMTLAKMLKFNSDLEGGVIYHDTSDRVPVQVSNSLLQYVAASPDEADPVCRLKFQRMATHASSKFSGLSLQRRTTPVGQPLRAKIFDPVFGRPQTSTSATYRTAPLPPKSLLQFPKDFEPQMAGTLPE